MFGRVERKSPSLVFVQGSDIFIEDESLADVSLRHPRTDQTRTSAQVSSISHLCLGVKGLSNKVFGVSGLGERS